MTLAYGVYPFTLSMIAGVGWEAGKEPKQGRKGV